MRHYSRRRREEGVRWVMRRGAAGTRGATTRGVEVRRKVVKVTVALTACARNNIGVQPSCAYIYARACVYVYVHESCARRARGERSGRFISSSACRCAFLSGGFAGSDVYRSRGVPMADLDRRLRRPSSHRLPIGIDQPGHDTAGKFPRLLHRNSAR